MAIESYHYGLRDLKISPWLAANSYGTAVDIDAARSFTVTLRVQSDELQGDDVIKDTFAKIIGVEARMEYGSVNQQVLDILSGGTLVSDAEYEDLLFGQDDNVPYFAIAGRVVGSDEADLHMFIPYCKLAGNLSYQAQQNSYLIPGLDIRGAYEGTVNGFMRIRKFVSPTTLAIPLATAAD